MDVALVGCGAIGSALLKGWLTQQDSHSRFKSFWVVAPHAERVDPFLDDHRVMWCRTPEYLPGKPDVIVFAIKPFQLDKVLPHYKEFDSLIISVASGKRLAFIETFFSEGQAIVRAMPNTPVSIHQGVIGLLGNQHLTPDQKLMVETCFNGLGYCPWLTSDVDIDKMTALSGSGPAYVFLMIEALSKAGVELGIDPQTSLSLAIQTFVGASLYAQQADVPPEVLRERVTSPHGTTSAALAIFEKYGLTKLIEAAVEAAFIRAKELGK